MRPKYPLIVIFFLLSLALYIGLAYFTERTQSTLLLTQYGLLFCLYGYGVAKQWSLTTREIFLIGLAFRLAFLGATPALSDDFYRFIWDARLWISGINPFAHLPTYFIDHSLEAPSGINISLFSQLNSQTHYTVYPPIPQYIGLLSEWLSPGSIKGSVLVMHLVVLLVESGSFYLLVKLLTRLKKDPGLVAIYFLNPLVILELTGNLHHESLMIFFLIALVLALNKENYGMAGAMLAFAVASKLIPLILLPYLLLMNLKRIVPFMGSFCLVLVLLFLPMFDSSFVAGMKDSLLLYYQKFEFNAGLYFIAREIGYWRRGFNMIAVIGKDFAIAAAVMILIFSIIAKIRRWDYYSSIQWIIMIYLSMTLILHPWYITTLIALSVVTRFRYPLIWSLLIFITYMGYTVSGYINHTWIYVLEYGILWVLLVYEIRSHTAWNFTLKDAP